MKQEILDICIQQSATITEALQQMDKVGRKLLIVINPDLSFFGLLSIGDIQRSIIRNVPMSSTVDTILRKDVTVAKASDNLSAVKERMKERRNEFMPVLDENDGIVDVIFWENLFEEKRIVRQINLPVVIMAGGVGSRLKPLTHVFPKPLIPLNEKTILELIMNQFIEIGCKKFYMSVNYKYEIIKYYIENLETPYNIDYFREEKPLGTIGSVALLKEKISSPFFVTNCDIIIDQDYSEVYDYHFSNKNDITIVTAVKSYKIPYGVIETGDNGLLNSLIEKPELSYMINTGVYILNPEMIDEIPKNEFYHITHLIEKIKDRGGRVGCFPVSDKSWIDIGDWDEYLKYIRR